MKRLAATLTALAVGLAGLAGPATSVTDEYVGRHRAVTSSDAPAPAFTSPLEAGQWRMKIRATP